MKGDTSRVLNAVQSCLAFGMWSSIIALESYDFQKIRSVCMSDEIKTVTDEWYYPAEDIVKNAHVPDYEAVYKEATDNPQAFWAKRAETLDWYQKWDKVLDDSNAP